MAQTKRLTALKTRQSGTPTIPQKNQPKRYALISVSDKTGIVDFARDLINLGYRIISTGGTAKVLTQAGISVIPIQEITGNPESFDGRMKTISFQIESAILYDRTNPSHRKQAEELGIKNIELVVCNLYPFEKTVANPKVKITDAVENIDVGGPTMIRAAAKNFTNVLVIIDPKNYGLVREAIENNLTTSDFRRELAAKAFSHLSFYDAQIAQYLKREKFPEEITLTGRRTFDLRYGENPHQTGAVYIEPNTNSPLAHLTRHAGRELSYMNFTDIFFGFESVRMFSKPAAVVIKHNSPAGIALGQTPVQSLTRAVAADPVSAFGGVIVMNKPMDLTTAKTFAAFKEEDGVLIDIVAAPAMTDEAKAFIKSVRKSTGIYTFGPIPDHRSNPIHARFFDGGFILQDWDDTKIDLKTWEVVTKVKPTEKQMEQMKLAWEFIGRIRSNSVLVVDKSLPITRGIGSGQTSRVMATKLALDLADGYTKSSVLASDSFFPFPDCVELAAKHNVAAIIQQGGSVNDQASIDAADKAGITMIMTNERKFWH